MSIAGLRSSGLRPLPSAGAWASVWDGEAKKVSSAQISAAEPSAATLGPRRRRELRRALRDQRVALGDELAVGHLPADDDLAPLAEGVGDLAAVADRQRRAATVAVADLEAQVVAAADDRAGGDLACQLVRACGGRPGQQLRRCHSVAG